MMRRCKRIGVYAFLLCCLLGVWGICLAYAQEIQRMEQLVELRYPEPTLTLQQVEKIQEEEALQEKKLITNQVAWVQKEQMQLKNENLGTRATAAMIWLAGDAHLLIPRQQVTGELVYPGDKKGAVITPKVAYDLWGSLDVIGKSFVYDKEEYNVRGILDKKEPVVILQLSDEQEDVKLTNMRVQLADTENILEQVNQFNARYGLKECTVINLSLIGILLGQLAYLPMWLVGFWAIIKWLKLLFETYQYWVASLVLVGVGAVFIVVILKTVAVQMTLPDYLIPNQWSDFEFWTRLWETMYANYLQTQSLPKFLPDLWRMRTIQIVWVTWGVSCIGALVGMHKIDTKDGKELFWQIILAIIISFSVIILGYSIGLQMIVPKAFWVIVPLYILIKAFCKWWKDFLYS